MIGAWLQRVPQLPTWIWLSHTWYECHASFLSLFEHDQWFRLTKLTIDYITPYFKRIDNFVHFEPVGNCTIQLEALWNLNPEIWTWRRSWSDGISCCSCGHKFWFYADSYSEWCPCTHPFRYCFRLSGIFLRKIKEIIDQIKSCWESLQAYFERVEDVWKTELLFTTQVEWELLVLLFGKLNNSTHSQTIISD